MIDLIYYVAASLDAYIATPEGGVGWLAPYENTGEDYGYAAFYATIDALVLGRRTYEQMLGFGHWPYAGKPCWVFSRQQLAPAALDVTMTSDSPARLMAALEARDIRRVWLVGGGILAASCRAHGLITTYIITVIPVILGAGIPLFAAPGPTALLTLVTSVSYPNGLVQLHYEQKRS